MTGNRLKRRTLLRWSATVGAVVGATGLASGNRSDDAPGRGTDDGADGNGFPPSGITEYGRSLDLGNGEVRPFTSETPSGEPKYHGVEFDRHALERLPDSDGLEAADNQAETDKYRRNGQALVVHRKWSLQHFVPFPDAAETPFTFLGLNWNPKGHPGGGGAWEVPHFDIHFHMLDPATIDAVDGGPSEPPYDQIPEEQLPEGYVRNPVPEERYIADVGEHVAPVNAPELPGNPDAFTATLIQGFVGVEDGDDIDPQLAFVEPMVTREYLTDASGVESFEVPHPEEYPTSERYPTEYSVRDFPSKDAVAVVLESFE